MPSCFPFCAVQGAVTRNNHPANYPPKLVGRPRQSTARPAMMALIAVRLAVFRELEDLWGIARALVGLGDVAWDRGEAEPVIELCEDNLPRFRQLGDAAFVGFSLHNLGLAARRQGD
jgi:hypothetical protein